MSRATLTLNKLLETLNAIAPFTLAETWDNVGLMVGDPDQQVRGILVALDATEEVLAEALRLDCNTIITHHPLIFTPVKKIELNTPFGRLLQLALQNDIAIVACHTNLDLINQGVSDALAERLGLVDTTPLSHKDIPAESASGLAPGGFGKIGRLSPGLAEEQFLAKLFAALKANSIQIAGHLPSTIERVALCGGSGSDLAATALQKGAQVYITGEVKHSVARWAEAAGYCIIDAGHYATENHIVPVLAEKLTSALKNQDMPLPVLTSAKQSNPFRCVAFHKDKPIYC